MQFQNKSKNLIDEFKILLLEQLAIELSSNKSFYFDILYCTILFKIYNKEINTRTKLSLYCITKDLN